MSTKFVGFTRESLDRFLPTGYFRNAASLLHMKDIVSGQCAMNILSPWKLIFDRWEAKVRGIQASHEEVRFGCT